jgi:6-phosphogluconolactonase/glucosamine-6-phosphate isomerase/deaminase
MRKLQPVNTNKLCRISSLCSPASSRVFDLVLLGLGPDGHTASLFPGTAALNETTRLVVANWGDKFKTYRITLTLPVLNRAACVMFLVSGADKADIVREVLKNENVNPAVTESASRRWQIVVAP